MAFMTSAWRCKIAMVIFNLVPSLALGLVG